MGIVRAKDLLSQLLSGKEFSLDAVLLEPLFVPETEPASRVLELLRMSGSHLALVIDEHGGVEGMVTSNDLLEAIVGAMPEPGEEEPEALRREDGSWLVDGLLDVMAFKDSPRIKGHLPDEQEGIYQTVAGLVLHLAGRIPEAGDRFECCDLVIEIADMDGTRIDKVIVAKKQS